jgi:hypothetical protein
MSACPVAQPSKLSASVKIESCTDLLFATKLLDCFGIRSYKKHGDLRRSLMLSDVRFVGWQSEFSFLYCKDYSYDLWSRKLSVFFHEFVASNQHLFWCDHNHKLPRIIGSWNRVKERGMLLKKVFFLTRDDRDWSCIPRMGVTLPGRTLWHHTNHHATVYW